MRLGFKRPVYVKSGNKVDIENTKSVYNYIEWLADTARKNGVTVSYGRTHKGHFVEIGAQRVYTIAAAKLIRNKILTLVAHKLAWRKSDKLQKISPEREQAFVRSLTPEQKMFWDHYKMNL